MHYDRIQVVIERDDGTEGSEIFYLGGGDQQRRVHIYRNLRLKMQVLIPFDFEIINRDTAVGQERDRCARIAELHSSDDGAKIAEEIRSGRLHIADMVQESHE